MSERDEQKRRICEIGLLMHQRGYIAANSGNISVRLKDGSVLITPTCVSKGALKPEDIANISIEGELLDKNAAPVSSETKMHLEIFKADSEIKAVVHTHSQNATYLSTFATMLSRPFSADIILQVGNIPVAPYLPLGTLELARAAAGYARNYNAVLLANHGAVTWGRSLDEAYLRTEAVENYCTLYMLDELHGRKARLLPADGIEKLLATRESMGVHKGGFPL